MPSVSIGPFKVCWKLTGLLRMVPSFREMEEAPAAADREVADGLPLDDGGDGGRAVLAVLESADVHVRQEPDVFTEMPAGPSPRARTTQTPRFAFISPARTTRSVAVMSTAIRRVLPVDIERRDDLDAASDLAVNRVRSRDRSSES